MRLIQNTKSYFDSATRYRGEDYFSDHRVRPTIVREDVFEAKVRGSDTYSIKLAWKELEVTELTSKYDLLVSCTCPHFLGNHFCKHLWAAILTASTTVFSNRADFLENIEARGEFYTEDDDYEPEPDYSGRYSSTSAEPKKNWKNLFELLGTSGESQYVRSELDPNKERWCYYVLGQATGLSGEEGLNIKFYHSERNRDGDVGKIKPLNLRVTDIPFFQDPKDQKALKLLTGIEAKSHRFSHYSSSREMTLSPMMIPMILPLIMETGRVCYGLPENSTFQPYHFENQKYDLKYSFVLTDASLSLHAHLICGESKVECQDIQYLVDEPSLFFTKGFAARYIPNGPHDLFLHLIKEGPLYCHSNEIDQFISKVIKIPFRSFPPIPEKLGWRSVVPECKPLIRILNNDLKAKRKAEICFRYEDKVYGACDQAMPDPDKKQKIIFLRDEKAEKTFLERVKSDPDFEISISPEGRHLLLLESKTLFQGINKLTSLGCDVEIEKSKIVQSGKFDVKVTSGVDWFDVQGKISFDGVDYTIPEILKNLQPDGWVKLKSNKLGIIPADVLEKYISMQSAGVIEGDKIKFHNQQAFLVDSLFSENWQVSVDKHFQQILSKIKTFEKVKKVPTPKGFTGKLRDYQKDGLSWLNFLREYGFGGCLADDMGLGKTIQVLALLQHDKLQKNSGKAPSLIVMPKSLIYNWQDEFAKFLPKFRVAVYQGNSRRSLLDNLDKMDVLLVTYQTLRSDIECFSTKKFNFAILDEAQSIKNPGAQAAKAVKIIKSNHRLALTGTPIENHFGDLLSIFQFLNPGLYAGKSIGETNPESLKSVSDHSELLLKGLRPFILRRTKEQVLKELPSKSEQVLFCEMGPEQKVEYDNLKEFYRNKLSTTISEKGLGQSKIFVLEALLRLRQMACHPALIHKDRKQEQSAKLEMFIEHLEEVIGSGHKLLVFSQFTSLLEIVTQHLSQKGFDFAYLDGQTKDRQAEVNKFQNDSSCKIFVISLKAGGVGLNLTAADYCFLLDPWWNPAVEAQAIDRIHRIGQKNKVFAYRMITKGTVEEKVLELQNQKRELSKALVSSDKSFMQKLKLEDLQWIFE